jgi:hypothetical protein
MLTKSELDNLLAETKSLKDRTEAAEKKIKDLEAEKADMIATKGYAPAGHRTTSDEARMLRSFGCSHPRQLLDVNVGHARFKGVPDELKHMALAFKDNVDVARWIAQLNGEPLDTIGKTEKQDRIASVKGMLDSRFGREVLAPQIKAFGSTVVGAGDEWVPTMISTSYMEEFELKRVLEGRFIQMPMPSNPFDAPKINGVTKARKATEGGTMTGGQFGTDKIRLTAVKLAEYYELPEELTEDSAPDFLMAGKKEVVLAQERAAESAIINGDDDGTHIDSDTQAGAADLAEKVWSGLRKLALANSANGSTVNFGNAFTPALLRQLRAAGGKYFSDPESCVWIVGPSIYTQFIALDNVATVDKFGPMATVLKGALAAYQGMPIINSEWFREDLNATGVYDGVTTDRGGVLLVNTKRFLFGTRRPIKVKLQQSNPNSDLWWLASYRRVDFKGHAQSATEKSVVYGYNAAK